MNHIFARDDLTDGAFENQLKGLLNQSVDDRVGTRRPAPHFQASGSRPERPRTARPWLLPLLAAACVVALTGGTVGAARLLATHGSDTPGTSPTAFPTPLSEAPTSSIPAAPTSSAPSPSAPQSAAPSASQPGSSLSESGGAAAAPTTVRLADADIWLPAGWSAVTWGSAANPSRTADTTWCVGPAVGHSGVTCLAWLERSIQAANAGGGYDSDAPGAVAHANPSLCGDSQQPQYSVLAAGDPNFGGRTADYRLFSWRCGLGSTRTYVQYLVPAGASFDLYAPAADSALQATMADIVRNSTLPAQTSAVRYYDHGYLRSLVPVAGGYRLSIDRVVPGPNGPVNDNPQTYEYFVTSEDWQVNLNHSAVGDLTDVYTDGSKVILTYKASP